MSVSEWIIYYSIFSVLLWYYFEGREKLKK